MPQIDPQKISVFIIILHQIFLKVTKFIAEFTEDENKLNVIRFKAAHSVWAGTVTRVAE